MKTIAITVKSFARTARKIVGEDADVLPAGGILLWPDPAIYDMVLLFLHPRDDGLAWVDDEGIDVLTVEDVERLPLAGSIVFVGACYGSENTALINALSVAGAKAVIHGPGVNFGGSEGVLAGADVLAQMLRKLLGVGLDIGAAWSMARLVVRIAGWSGMPGAADALEYALDTYEARQKSGAWFAGLIILVMSVLSLLFSNVDFPDLLTTFSSVPAPPGITEWDKSVYRNSTAMEWWSAAIPITGTDTIRVVDTITATGGITFTLVETWDTSAITLTAVYTTGTGALTVFTDTGVITWNVASALAGPQTLTKYWSVVSGSWGATTITETLATSTGSRIVYVSLEHEGWTPTPVPTWTPWYTPIPWDETPYPTSTPCAGIGCVPYDELPGIEYYIWLPLVMRSYGDGMSYGGPAPIVP
jgi:hypothetical protein